MEQLLEIALMFLWDIFKTVVLQYLLEYFKEWWQNKKAQTI